MWSYNYHLKLKNSEINLTFNDGEVEKAYWFSKDDILKLIEKKELITEDSVDIFKSFIQV